MFDILAGVLSGISLLLSGWALLHVHQYPSRAQLGRIQAELADTLAVFERLADRITRNAKSAGARLARALDAGATWDNSDDGQFELTDEEPPTLDDFKRAKGLDR